MKKLLILLLVITMLLVPLATAAAEKPVSGSMSVTLTVTSSAPRRAAGVGWDGWAKNNGLIHYKVEHLAGDGEVRFLSNYGDVVVHPGQKWEKDIDPLRKYNWENVIVFLVEGASATVKVTVTWSR
jgi:hypothetical protein